MELEKLTKTQIVLLTLLVSFVTSIATGIVTVTLMDQAPPGVSHTINRVVERTVERVVPQKNNNTAAVSETVVVESDEQIANAVGQNEQSLVRVYAVTQTGAGTTTQENTESTEGEQQKTKETFVALGFIASPEGLIVTDSGAISQNGVYTIRLANGNKVNAGVVRQDEEKGVGLMEVEGAGGLTAVSFGHASSLSLGQTVLTLIGEHNTALSQGLANEFEMGTLKGEGNSEERYRENIYTSLSLDAHATGSALFTMEGDIVGMVLVREGRTHAISAEAITSLIKNMHESGDRDNENPEENAEPEA